jgi:hypothetical protein
MLEAHFDESGHSCDTAFVTMAGLVAHEYSWLVLEAKWKEALKAHGLSQWHTTDYANSLKEYSTWKGDEEKRRRAYGVFISLIEELDGVPLGATVSMADWNQLSDAAKRYLVDPYYLIFQACLHRASEYRIGISGGNKLRVIFDNNKEFTGRIPKIYQLLRREFPLGDQLLASPVFSSAASSVRMQAADLVAYEVRHFQDNWLKRPHLKPRWGYEQLIKMVLRTCKFGPLPWFSNFSEEALVGLDSAICQQLEP